MHLPFHIHPADCKDNCPEIIICTLSEKPRGTIIVKNLIEKCCLIMTLWQGFSFEVDKEDVV